MPNGVTLAQLADPARWGNREDGTPKGAGFLGPLVRPDGGVSTELSMGTTDVNGQEAQIPLLVPTLSPEEVRYLLKTQTPDWDAPIMGSIASKAIDFAKGRLNDKRPVFADYAEQNTRVFPDMQRAATPDRAFPSHLTLAELARLSKH